ncbi:hypothetical protein [Streptomyces sp. GC420]|uniref:hypothetical protein n=1 Tax=Streptomyces sp. GC420 TaxID=2697568 RepID=UPI001414F2A2|nr:hypothetical protein [Streptomyces sp. GC420]NBM17124.1 hypothetical protein [Streptomyces sp. GC420]
MATRRVDDSADDAYEAAGAGNPHEATYADEMTIQLEGVGRTLGNLPPVPGGSPEGADGPVFVDESGNRRRKLRRVGIFFGVVFGCYAVVLVFSLLGGNASAPWLGIPGQEEKNADTVEPAPSGSVPLSPGVTPSLSPGVTPTVSNGVTVTPSGSVAGSGPATEKETKNPAPSKSTADGTGGTGSDPDPVDPDPTESTAGPVDPVDPVEPSASTSEEPTPDPSDEISGGAAAQLVSEGGQ